MLSIWWPEITNRSIQTFYPWGFIGITQVKKQWYRPSKLPGIAYPFKVKGVTGYFEA